MTTKTESDIMEDQSPLDLFPLPGRQVPSADEVFFDHVAWLVHDMDAASEVFEKLGFKLTPYSVHGNRDPETGERVPQGTANRLAMLGSGYIELLCDAGDVVKPVVEDLRARLDRYSGVHLLAFSDSDAEDAYKRISNDGFRLQPMVELRRDVEAADGSQDEVKFSVIRAAFDEIPEGRIQALTHHTPDLMWQDRYIARDNGISGMVDAVVCVENPTQSAERMAHLLAQKVVVVDDHETAVVCARGGLRFVTQNRLAEIVPDFKPASLPYTAAIGFKADDYQKSADFFHNCGMRVFETEDGIIVHPDDSLGTAMIVYRS